MYTIPRKNSHMARKKQEGPVVNFQFKMYGELAKRWQEIKDRAKKKNPYLDDTDINRRLLGLDSDIKAVVEAVTEKDRLYFLSSPSGGKQAEIMGRLTGKIHLTEVSKRKRR